MRLILHMHRGDDEVAGRAGALPGVEVLRVDTPERFAREVAGARGAVISATQYTVEVAAAVRGAPMLQWIQCAAAGYDPFVRHGVPPGVVVTNAAGVWGPTVAEHAMSLLLALVRRLPRAERNRVLASYDREATADRLGSLEGASVLIVGFGSIGREIAVRARAFAMRVIAVNRDGRDIAGADEVLPVARLREALPRADAVVLCAPLTGDTASLIGAEELALMRRGAHLVNVGRGGLVDQAALVAALETGAIAGAGLDVFENEPLASGDPLWGLPNVILTPHVAGYGGASFARLGDLVVENATRLQAGRPLVNVIDPAELSRAGALG